MSNVQLRLIEHGDLPQLRVPQDPEYYPPELILLSDRLQDHGHVELGPLVLNQYLRYRRLVNFCQFLLDEVDAPPEPADEPEPDAPPTAG